LVELGFDRSNDARITKADLVNVVAVEIHVAPALQVFDINPVAALEHVEARRGQ